MKNIPDKELKEIAIGLRSGEIISHLQIPERDWLMTFPILSMLGKKTMAQLKKDAPGMILGRVKGYRGYCVNGVPIFLSCQMISKHDADRVRELVQQLEAAEKAV